MALSREICSLLEKGATEKVHPLVQGDGFYSTYFLVPKKDGGFRGDPMTNRDVNGGHSVDSPGFTPPQTTTVMEQQFGARSHQPSPLVGCNFSLLHLCVEAVGTGRVSEGRSAPGSCFLSSGTSYDRRIPHRVGAT